MAGDRARLLALDACLVVLEEALAAGRTRVDAGIGARLRGLFGAADLIPDHRLEGRRIDRVLDDVFALQSRILGGDDESAAG